jgi:energy-converting hydrogenase Eha subunit C
MLILDLTWIVIIRNPINKINSHFTVAVSLCFGGLIMLLASLAN